MSKSIESERFYRATDENDVVRGFYVVRFLDNDEVELDNSTPPRKTIESVDDLLAQDLEEVDPDEIGMTRTKDVARWMARELYDRKVLDHDVIVTEIHNKFGDEFVRPLDSGNYGLAQKLQPAFRKEYEGWAEYNPSHHCWESYPSNY